MSHREKKSDQTQNDQSLESAFSEIINMAHAQFPELEKEALENFARFYQSKGLSQLEKIEMLELLGELRISPETLRLFMDLSDQESFCHLEILEAVARKAVSKSDPVIEGAEDSIVTLLMLSARLAIDAHKQSA